MAELFGHRPAAVAGVAHAGGTGLQRCAATPTRARKAALAESLNDKVLHADADVNKADWLAALAGAVGVIGIGFGLWWMDAAAAIFIGGEILRDGLVHMRSFSLHLLGSAPRTVDYSRAIPGPEQVEEAALGIDWVREARVRLREEGRVYFGEVFLVPVREKLTVDEIDAATRKLY